MKKKSQNKNEPHKFTGYERDQESGLDYAHARYRDINFGFISTDPMWWKYPNLSSYVYAANNLIMYVDTDGNRPIPLDNPYNKWHVKVDSWFGHRNTGLRGASTNHQGLDFNYSGGGNTDYGTPILAAHEGIATIYDDVNSSAGRYVVITSPDGSFRTRYIHLSEITVKDGQYVSESDNIGNMGGSAFGSDTRWQAHLHYEIQKLQDGKWVSIDPTAGRGNNMSNIIDPQKWITPDNIIYKGVELPEVTIYGSGSPYLGQKVKPLQIEPMKTEDVNL